jgi:putative MATE family efflux protein
MYQIIDAFWVGQLGKEAVAAVAISFSIFFVVNSIIFGVSSIGTTLIGQAKGRRDQEKIDFYASQTTFLLTGLGLILGLLGAIFAPQLIGLFGAEVLVASLATEYLRIIFIGLIFLFLYTGLSSALRGIGEVKLPMVLALIGVVLNFFLDPILMLGFGPIPRMGISGVAWATTITQGISALITFIWLYKHKELMHIKREYFYFDKKTFTLMLKLGLPSTAEFLSRSIGMVALTFIVTWFGTTAIAAYGIGQRLGAFALIPSFGISLAINTLIAQNLGANKTENIWPTLKKGMIFSFALLFVLATILFILAEPLSGFFVTNSPEVIKESAFFLQLYAYSLCFIGAQVPLISAYRAAGKTKTAMNLSIAYVIFQVILALLLAQFFGLMGVWLAYLVSNSLTFFVIFIYYKKNPVTKSYVEN